MLYSLLTVLGLPALAAAAAAPIAAPMPLELTFNVHRGSSSSNAAQGATPYFSLSKRDGSGHLEATLYNEQTFYMANISIGTPGQNVGVLIDTGSSDLWVMDSANPYCSSSSSVSAYRSDDTVLAERFRNHTISKPFLQYSKNIDKKALNILKRDSPQEVSFSSTVSSSATQVSTLASQQKNLFSEIASFLGGGSSTEVLYSTYSVGTSNPSATSTIGSGSSSSYSSGSVAMDCEIYGTFSESGSSSFNSNDTSFLIQYGDSTFASGTWSHDNVQLGGTTIENLSFALANESNSTMGVLGIGLPGLETTYSSIGTSNSYIYENLPMKLVSSGVINRNAYSIYLNTTMEASTGSVLFGAVDSSKYTGSLEIIKVINTMALSNFKDPIKLEVSLSSVYVNGGSSQISPANVKYPTLLDTGTTMVYLPQSLLTLITKNINGSPQYDSSLGVYTMACSSAGDQKVTFNFSGKTIDVPLTNLLLTVSSISGSSSSSSSATCALGLIPVSSNRLILGDLFLRSAYVVYDLDNYQVAIAQAANATSSSSGSIQAIISTIPGATTASAYSATYSGATSIDPGTSGAPAATGQTSSSSSTSGSSSGNKHNAAMSTRNSIDVVTMSLGMFLTILCLSGYATVF